jgi:hypothetical protein
MDKARGIEGGGLDDLPLEKIVKHAKGQTGWVLHEDNKRKRPTFLVMTGAGQRVWWFQDRCKVLNEGDPFVEAVRKGMGEGGTSSAEKRSS